MKTAKTIGMAVLMVIVCSLMAACSSDNDEYAKYAEGGLRYNLWFSSTYDKDYYGGTVDVPYDARSDDSYFAWLRLEFMDDQDSNDYLETYNRNKDWYLECNASWILLENRSGKVTSKLKRVNLTIQDNESDRDREAIIYMTVPEAVSGEQSLIIHQYGRSHRAKTGENYSIKVAPFK